MKHRCERGSDGDGGSVSASRLASSAVVKEAAVKVVLPSDQVRKLARALARARTSESGGQLFGEQLAPSSFRVTDLTVQRQPGSFASFVVDVDEAARAATAFFRRTGHDYSRHNYIGEWHSHPSFAVQPSSKDSNTMRELVTAEDFVGSFAVLMIARLDGIELQAGAWLYNPGGYEQPVTLEIQDGRQ
jgi:[CysO sulfur-carrier protein]-S-L-cysteine hydrolase